MERADWWRVLHDTKQCLVGAPERVGTRAVQQSDSSQMRWIRVESDIDVLSSCAAKVLEPRESRLPVVDCAIHGRKVGRRRTPQSS